MDVTCTAKAKSTGARCRNGPIPGGTVCRIHGGAAPQVKAVAARRVLAALVGPALTRLKDLLEDPDTPKPVLMAAIRDTLDRTGYKAPVAIEGTITLDVVEREIARLQSELAE